VNPCRSLNALDGAVESQPARAAKSTTTNCKHAAKRYDQQRIIAFDKRVHGTAFA